jgi:hypothetical protein
VKKRKITIIKKANIKVGNSKIQNDAIRRLKHRKNVQRVRKHEKKGKNEHRRPSTWIRIVS